MLTKLEKECFLTNSQVSMLWSAIFLGILITSLMAGCVNNKIRKKTPSIIGTICLFIFSIKSSFTQSFWQMFIIKIMIGVGAGIIIPGTTSLITESIPKKNRCLALNMVWGLYLIGIIYVCFIAINFVNRNILVWRSTYLVNSFSSILTIFLSLYLKEGPRYLIINQNFRQGFKILNLIGKPEGISLTI